MNREVTPMQKALYDRIATFLAQNGVERFILVCNDPDSDTVLTKATGELAWRAGALQLQLRQTLKEWDDDECDHG